jgi:hypothetical protein
VALFGLDLEVGRGRKRRSYAVNLFVCAVISIPVVTTLYGIGDEIYRCEVRRIQNCD